MSYPLKPFILVKVIKILSMLRLIDWKVFEIMCISNKLMGHVFHTHNFQPFLIECISVLISLTYVNLETESVRTKAVSISLHSLT